MRRRRRRLIREDVLAPWITMAVVFGLWWLAASAVAPGTPSEPRPSARDEAAVSNAAGPIPAERTVLSPEKAALLKPDVRPTDGDVDTLREMDLQVPVAGVERASLNSSFDEMRGGSGRRHEAIDILAPRGTAVNAVHDGRIARLFTSAAGGLTVYQFHADEEFCFYYAHLDAYAPGLAEGQAVRRGQTLGYVGTTGNAPPGTPHLHFAIFRLGEDKRWWEGTPVDPYPVLR